MTNIIKRHAYGVVVGASLSFAGLSVLDHPARFLLIMLAIILAVEWRAAQ